MSVTAPSFYNGQWAFIDSADVESTSGRGIEGPIYIQAISITTQGLAGSCYFTDVDGNRFLQRNISAWTNEFIKFKPALYCPNGIKTVLGNGLSFGATIFLGKRENVGWPLGKTKYPPENGHATGFTANRWYQDDIMGTMHPEDKLSRDYHGRLRESRDIDAPDRDELLDGHTPPTEIERDEP